MGVVQAPFQTVEEIYGLIWVAVANRQPIEAAYQGRQRLFCPHRLGRNRDGRLRVLCYQYGGDSRSGLQPIGSPENWRCILGGHLKTGHRRTLQNRPTEQNQNKNIYTSPEVVRANIFPHLGLY